ncbi:MAG: D-serine ammonia-lyase [Eubacteriales bacterium]
MDITEKLKNRNEMFWQNPKYGTGFSAAVSYEELDAAKARLARFAPYIARRFPETADNGGIIDSPLTEAPHMKAALERNYKTAIEGRLFIKRDGELAVSGSVKARGGIYEVLCRAEEAALSSGLLNSHDDYSVLCEDCFRKLFAQYTLSVGSTGNLGLSVGIMGAALGFNVEVHMSSDAKDWKKSMLRSRGVLVIEHEGDYGSAVAEGRLRAAENNHSFFIDDESSTDLFYGYAAAADRFAVQLSNTGTEVNAAHPLTVYLPCGVGTSPGGIAYGLHRIYGENVYCFFCEPVDVPCMLLGMATEEHADISVYNIGLSGRTAADGLACAVPSQFVGRVMEPLLRGIFTSEDDELFRCLAMLSDSEGLFCEPSACIGFIGPVRLPDGIVHNIHQGTHVVWTTGGSMVPSEERIGYYERGKKIL